MEFVDFVLPFDGRLSEANRWIKLAALIPWEEFEEAYSKNLAGSGMGAPAKPVRLALGSLIIREQLGCSDIEAVEQIRENPYLQYFLGFSAFSNEPPFDPSMFVHFRKRFDLASLGKINELIIALNARDKAKKAAKNNDDDDQGAGTKKNSGKLIIDATCAPADITHPTDLKLAGKAREKTELIIDRLHEADPTPRSKPRTYRRKARREYLKAAKTRGLSGKQRIRVIKKQLNYLSRNLKSINKLGEQVGLQKLPSNLYADLLVLEAIHRQQRQLYFEGKYRVANRIVSLAQPHIRPIVRSKARAKTEFGAKISLSIEEGLCHLHRFDFDSYNECEDLIEQVELYKRRHRVYPESVHADNAYRNKKNRCYCRERGIRLSGAPFGKRSNWKGGADCKLAYQDLIDRVAIEGKIGQAKRRYSLGLVMTKLASTTRTSVAITIITMNLLQILRRVSSSLFALALRAPHLLADLLSADSPVQNQSSTPPAFQG